MTKDKIFPTSEDILALSIRKYRGLGGDYFINKGQRKEAQGTGHIGKLVLFIFL